MRNPCLQCEFQNRNKNHRDCIECVTRHSYVKSIGDMTHSLPINQTDIVKNMNENNLEENGELKRCLGCGKLKNRVRFGSQYKAKDGLNSHCRDCMSKKISEGHLSKKDKRRKFNKKATDNSTVPLDLSPGFTKHENNDGTILLDLQEHPELMEKIINTAEAELRTPANQVIYWLKNKIHGQ